MGTDFSPQASCAVGRAARLAAERDAVLEIVHAIPQRRTMRHADGHGVERRLLGDEMQRARALGVPVSGFMRTGRALPLLEDAVEGDRADLVVLGTRPHRTMRERLLGTLEERFIEGGNCDTLVVRKKARERYRHALVCVALGPVSERLLAATARLARSALVSVLHAYEPPYEMMLQSYDVDPDAIAGHRRSTRREGREKLLELLVRAGVARERVDFIQRRGYAASVILGVAARRDCDLIVLGKGPSGLSGLIFGSVVKRVLRHAPCDVLVVAR